jgi:N-acetylmuramoyl-L-alanine amidase
MLAALAALVLSACATGARSNADASARSKTDASATPSAARAETVLGSRLEMVALADRLAVEAQHAERAKARDLLERAATIRERLYRVERRNVDALEAMELWGLLEKQPGEGCRAALRRALLDGEVRREPGALYKRLYALKLSQGDPACQARADRALLGLAAYRPLPNVLTEIERELRSSAPGAASATGAAPGSGAAGEVVSPSDVPSGPAEIARIERYGAEDAARVVVFVSRPRRFEVGEVKASGAAEPRLYVDIDGATYDGKSSYDVGGLVQKVRVGSHARGTRVVLDLRGPVEPRVFYLPEPFRLVIDVFARERARALARPRSVRRVVLDPGHGGHDPGATGPNGLREKDVALDIAHRAAPAIARELGITTLLTRDADRYVALDERTARANAFHADLFVSIHCNASIDGVAKGVMTFVLDRAREDVAERLAARENAASASAAAELANVFSRVADPAHTNASLRFAELLQRAATASLAQSYPDIPNGGVQRAGFYVLAGARMPAVLFETSFISNESGETRLNTGDFRQKMADAIVNAVRAYRDGR